jgi:2-keto-4-pentenoate hydratase/2-oxohepta-3-ene-1,7-dioic acid hydratase in catechol pathway
MRHTFADIIAYSSADETLYPGEVLGSGTVGGGCGNELGRFMKHGDVIELEVSGIGVLRNTIVAPHVPAPPAMPIKIL